MIGTNAESEKKSDEISAQDVDVISTPKIITVESMLCVPDKSFTITSIQNFSS